MDAQNKLMFWTWHVHLNLFLPGLHARWWVNASSQHLGLAPWLLRSRKLPRRGALGVMGRFPQMPCSCPTSDFMTNGRSLQHKELIVYLISNNSELNHHKPYVPAEGPSNWRRRTWPLTLCSHEHCPRRSHFRYFLHHEVFIQKLNNENWDLYSWRMIRKPSTSGLMQSSLQTRHCLIPRYNFSLIIIDNPWLFTQDLQFRSRPGPRWSFTSPRRISFHTGQITDWEEPVTAMLSLRIVGRVEQLSFYTPKGRYLSWTIPWIAISFSSN